MSGRSAAGFRDGGAAGTSQSALVCMLCSAASRPPSARPGFSPLASPVASGPAAAQTTLWRCARQRGSGATSGAAGSRWGEAAVRALCCKGCRGERCARTSAAPALPRRALLSGAAAPKTGTEAPASAMAVPHREAQVHIAALTPCRAGWRPRHSPLPPGARLTRMRVVPAAEQSARDQSARLRDERTYCMTEQRSRRYHDNSWETFEIEGTSHEEGETSTSWAVLGSWSLDPAQLHHCTCAPSWVIGGVRRPPTKLRSLASALPPRQARPL